MLFSINHLELSHCTAEFPKAKRVFMLRSLSKFSVDIFLLELELLQNDIFMVMGSDLQHWICEATPPYELALQIAALRTILLVALTIWWVCTQI